MQTFTDHLGRTIQFDYPPKRIVSLVPAITETMYYLGLENEIVGRTRFCIYPKDKVLLAKNIGGTKDINIDRIHKVKPDLIIAEKEENTKEIVETLERYYPVFVFEVQNTLDVFRMIEDLGLLTDTKIKANKLTKQIQIVLQNLPHVHNKRAAYVIWKNPYMVVGRDTYIQSLLDKMGFIIPFTLYEGRYPTVFEQDFLKENLDYVLLATEPYPFREKHLKEWLELLPNVTPLLVDGEMFWYGAKMLQSGKYFNNLFQKL